MDMDRRVLFVCTGNVCRSPMAEYIFRNLMARDDEWESGSAGTAAWDGQPASDYAVSALAEWNIDLTPHRSRRLRADLIEHADILVVMTRAHRQEIVTRHPRAADRIRTLRDFDARGGPPDIDDPIGASRDVYRHVRDDIHACLMDLILFLKGK